MLDKRVPLRIKILPFIAIAYIVFNRDILPDVFPIIGFLDDLIITAVAMILYFALGSASRITKVPDESKHGDDNTSETSSHTVIDGEFHVVEDENNQERK